MKTRQEIDEIVEIVESFSNKLHAFQSVLDESDYQKITLWMNTYSYEWFYPFFS